MFAKQTGMKGCRATSLIEQRLGKLYLYCFGSISYFLTL